MIIIDTETGGLDPRGCALVSVAAVHVESNALFYGIVAPVEGLRLEEGAEQVHGLTMDYLLEHGLEESEVLGKLNDWLGQWEGFTEWGGANPAFDGGFLHAAFERCKKKKPGVLWRRPVDVLSLGWLADRMGLISLPLNPRGGKNGSLVGLVQALYLPGRVDLTHSSMEDAVLCARVFRRLMSAFSGMEVRP
jgi:DNA polymerase III epsilon subunit-like protein